MTPQTAVIVSFYVTTATAALAIGIPAYRAWRASRLAETDERR